KPLNGSRGVRAGLRWSDRRLSCFFSFGYPPSKLEHWCYASRVVWNLGGNHPSFPRRRHSDGYLLHTCLSRCSYGDGGCSIGGSALHCGWFPPMGCPGPQSLLG